MEIKTMSQLSEPFRSDERTIGQMWELALTEIKRNFPIDGGCCNAVNYDSRSDRYVETFTIGDKDCKVKLTVPVAKFVLANPRIRDKDGRASAAMAHLRLDENGAMTSCW
jgi:hypothetical protein